MMTDRISALKEYIANEFPDVRVSFGCAPESSESPLLKNAVFVSAERIEAEKMELRLAVYVQRELGGNGALTLAEGVAVSLSQVYCPYELEDITVGSVEYVRSCKAFRTAVRCVHNAPKLYLFSASDFSHARGFSLSCGMRSYTVKRCFEPYPVMTIFRDIWEDVIDGENTYDITLPDVPKSFVEEFAGKGMFKLTLDGEEFYDCYVVSSEENETALCTVKVRGSKYLDEEDDDSIELPIR